MANTHGLVVPQSQMFTSFGMPAASKLPVQVMSQRRSTKKKNTLPQTTHSQPNFSKKRLRGLSGGGSKGKSKRGPAGQQNFQAASVQLDLQHQILQSHMANGNLVEMPILSEEFLNQLNEEQLQALLEQQ